jgi:peptidoglycan hydrolase-like protein with peptidoglycan-binding domain
MNLYDFYKSEKEYTFEAVAADKELAKHVQEVLIWFNLLSPPADAKFGPISSAALREFQELMKLKEKGFLGPETAKKLIQTRPDDLPLPDIIIGKDFASRIISYMKSNGYEIAKGTREYNIVYVEGIDADGTVNRDAPNYFNDRRFVIQILDRKPKIIGNWEATTEPGFHYTYKPMNPKGAARIKFGQYKAWRIGRHGTSEPHEALIQVAPVTVHRDFNRDMIRTGDRLDTGYFGINQHWGYDLPRNNIYFASAGCLVGRTRQGHREFMELIKQDNRYQLNKRYTFVSTIIPGDGLPS